MNINSFFSYMHSIQYSTNNCSMDIKDRFIYQQKVRQQQIKIKQKQLIQKEFEEKVKMGVPGFYSWLIKRYPLAKHMVGKQSLPEIDYLYLDMNGIIYKCVKDDSVIFKSQIMPKEFQEIWVQVFNYINTIVNLLKPGKMIFLALDGVAPRSKMNNQRARRFKSARDYKQFIQRFYGYNEQSPTDSQQNFKNNSISPGTKFMQELNEMIHFFIQKKIQEDDYWKNLSIIFTGSDCPGEGEHKIMQWIRTNKHQFSPNDCHCLYGADADLIMLGLTLPMKNICIIREEYIHSADKVKIKDSKKQKFIQFEMIFLTILREYFDLEYQQLKGQLKNLQYSISKIIKDFVFLFFFIGNDFLPRCMAFNIRERSIEKLIGAFKAFLIEAQNYVVGEKEINIKELARLCNEVSKYEATFIEEKAQDAKRYLDKKVQFDDEFAQIMSQKVMKQSQFLNQLKQFYMNQDNSLRFSFYQSKFGIDPSEKIEDFYAILGYYLHGLKFVFEYYFLNLSSWSWYYPHYYAPLLSDVSFYLNYLAQNGTKLQDLQLGEPFQPFKQLLCILPKESCQLLPEPFQKYLKNHQSPLRSPFDFYPDHFEDDLYGSIRSHEAVSLIPFLDHSTISNVYDEAIQGVKSEELRRNKFQKTRLYQYDDKSPQVTVKSPLSVIQSFNCNIKIQEIDLLHEMKWMHNGQKAKYGEKVLLMPTLEMKDHQASLEDDKRSIRFLLEITEPEDKTIKLGNHIYYGFPLEHSGRIEALLTREGFLYSPDFNPLNYYLDEFSKDYSEVSELQRRRKQLFQDLIDAFRKKEFSYMTLKNVQTLAFIIDTQYFNRTLCGAFERVYTLENDAKTYEIVPLAMVSKQKKYQTTKSDFRFKSLEEQFPLGTEVLLAHPDGDICGDKAKVIGYKDKKVQVQVSSKLKLIKPQKLDKIVNTDEIFLDLRFVSQIIKMKPDIALTILDTVSIQLPRQKNLPQAIDIGLNFINRQDNKIVPNLVRVNFAKEYVIKQDPKKIFKHLELSIKAFEMLIEYKKKYPEVLQFITHRHQKLVDEAKSNQKPINWRQKMKATDIYADDGKTEGRHQQITKNLMRVYLWLIKNKETHMPMSSIYSKQISYKKIAKLEEYFKVERNLRKKKNNNEQLLVDPNFLYSLKLARMGFLYLSSRPDDHAIGDQIVCLHPEHFGHFGVVIGIDNDRYEVIFEKPSFGKTDLGGLCSNLWGGKFRFKQLLNIDLWPKYFKEREETKKILQNSGWIDTMKVFYPRFKSNPIRNFNDFQMIVKNQVTSKLLDPSTIEYVQKIKSDIKQIEVDKDYVVVDNANKDYLFKYDKKETTVSQQEVDDLAKNKKWMEKKVNDIKNEDFEKEIIENKMADLTLVESELTKEQVERKQEPKQEKKIAYVQKQVVEKPKPQEAKQVKKQLSNQNGNKKQKYVEKVEKPKVEAEVPKPQQVKVNEQNIEFGEQEDAEDILG